MPRPTSVDAIRNTLDLAGRELQILHQISQSISCSLDLDQVLTQIVDLVIEVTRGDSCLLYLLDPSGESLVLRASKNPHPRIIGKVSLKVGEGITGWVAREATPVAIPRHASKDPRFKLFHNLPEDRFEAFLSMPIVAPPERVIGVVNVQHRRAHRHDEREKTLLSIIAHQVGSAIENARLYEETTRRALRLATLAKVGQIIVSGGYVDEILQLVVAIVTQMMQASSCSIMLVDEGRKDLVLKAVRHFGPQDGHDPAMPADRDLISRVIRSNEPVIVSNIAGGAASAALTDGVRSLLSVPISIKRKVIGAITVYTADERNFAEEDIRLLSTVAQQAALAIENTNLMLEAQETQEALQTRKTVERAKGVLQKRDRLTEAEAYRRLQQQSMRTRRSMREIAEAVILADEIRGTTIR